MVVNYFALALVGSLLSQQAEAEVVKWSYTNEDEPRLCLTNCDYFGKPFKWCWVSQGMWAKCTPGEANLLQKTSKATNGETCVSICGNMEGCDSYNDWCFTSENPKILSPCRQTDIQYLYLSPTENGDVCRTPCSSTFECGISWVKSKSCTPGDLPINLTLANSFRHYSCESFVKYLNSLDTKKTPKCDYLHPDVANMIKFEPTTMPGQWKNNSVFNLQPFDLLRGLFNDQLVSMQTIPNPENPVISHVRSITANLEVRVHYIHAEIHPRHVFEGVSNNFIQSLSSMRMRELGARIGDERGHLLAASLGGSNEMWNLAPQSSAFNRGGNWRRIEIIVQERVRSLPAGHFMNWELFPRYPNGSTRPGEYTLIFSERDANGNVVGDVQAAQFVDENEAPS